MNAKPKRRRFRYSLRTLLVFVTIASAGFGWLGMKVRAKQREREVVKAIRKLDGLIYYDYQFDGPDKIDTILTAIPPGPAWLRKLIGDDFFAKVECVTFGSEMTDAELAQLKWLKQLSELYIADTQVTDAGLAHVEELSQLERLFLAGTQVTDQGLAKLKGLTHLKYLDVSGTQVTDAGCLELKMALPNLAIDRTAR